MKQLDFYKLQASGNDFVLIDQRPKTKDRRPNCRKLAKNWCQRKLGIGADGLLVIEPSKRALFKMRIVNADGSEAEMCGNGARCAALWANLTRPKTKDHPTTPRLRRARRLKTKIIKFETKAGIIKAEARNNGEVRIKVTDPFDLKYDLPISVLGRKIKVNYINTGVPHTVIFVEGLDSIDVDTIGRAVRFHEKFSPAGTNVNFVEILQNDSIKVRTYERGVGETLACGTGVIASAIVTRLKTPRRVASRQRGRQDTRHKNKIKVLTKSGETLNVYFNNNGSKIDNVWLEGKVFLVYRGEINFREKRGSIC